MLAAAAVASALSASGSGAGSGSDAENWLSLPSQLRSPSHSCVKLGNSAVVGPANSEEKM